MEELIWGALVSAARFAVLFFVGKAAVKAAILEVREEKKEMEKPKEENRQATEEQVSSKGE